MIIWTTALNTMKDVYEEIVDGEDPWIALGNFTNDFYEYYAEQREELIKEPPVEPLETNRERHRWAVFCAASVEYLCNKYDVPCPQWVSEPAYVTLPEAWFFAPQAALRNARVKEFYQNTTPIEFQLRNIYCGNRILQHKREEAEKFKAKLLQIKEMV